jgi:phosphocarrier protein HPr
MPQRTVIIGSSQGLHARPAKLLVEAAARQPVQVLLSIGDGRSVRADSMLSVLSLGAVAGSTVTLHAEDADGAERALEELATLIAADLDAPDPAVPGATDA